MQNLQPIIDSGNPYGLLVNSFTLGAELSRFQLFGNLHVAVLNNSFNNFLEHGDIRFITRAPISLITDQGIRILSKKHKLPVGIPIEGRVICNGKEAVVELAL